VILYHAGQYGGRGGQTGDGKESGRLALLRAGIAIPFALVSYADVDNLASYTRSVALLRKHGVRRLFLDSGAFSAWTRGLTVEFEDLYELIDAFKPEVYVQLDVIGEPEGTRLNLERMRADGYRPLPVFTRGAPWSDLTRLLDEDEDYICLGNIAKAKKPVRMEWCGKVFALTRDWCERNDRPLTRYHAFGVTEQNVLTAFPFYSCDSSAALMVSAFGNTLAFRDGRLRTLDLGGRHAHQAPHLVDQLAGDLMYTTRRGASIEALNAMARHITKVWRERGVVWPDQQEHPC
jgi:hypothetical protein